MATEVTFDDIVRLLRKDGWTFGIGEQNSITMAVEGDRWVYSVLIRYQWEKEIVVVYVQYPFHVPEEKRVEVLDLVARINLGLIFGTCEFDRNIGIIRFRSTMLTDGAPFHPEQFSTMLASALTDTERYAPAFSEVLEKTGDVDRAIALVERS
jgi:hypothetical protein